MNSTRANTQDSKKRPTGPTVKQEALRLAFAFSALLIVGLMTAPVIPTEEVMIAEVETPAVEKQSIKVAEPSVPENIIGQPETLLRSGAKPGSLTAFSAPQPIR